jgi:hypothetical protein
VKEGNARETLNARLARNIKVRARGAHEARRDKVQTEEGREG